MKIVGMPVWMASSIFSVKQSSTKKLTFHAPSVPFTPTSLIKAFSQKAGNGRRHIKRQAMPPVIHQFCQPYFIKFLYTPSKPAQLAARRQGDLTVYVAFDAKGIERGTISRVLFSSLRAERNDGHLSRILIAQNLKRPYPPRLPPIRRGIGMGGSHPLLGERSLFGLAPSGVYQATLIAQDTGELLPRPFTLTLWNRRSRHSTGRYPFCGTFLTL